MIFGLIVLLLGLVTLGVGILLIRQLKEENRRRKRRGRPQRKLEKIHFILFGVGVVLFLLGILFMILFAGGGSGFEPKKTESSDPAQWGIRWEVFDGGESVSEYQREEEISFEEPENYFALPGVATFRGNAYRNDPSYGTAKVKKQSISTVWNTASGELAGTKWAGSGWTGQPLVVAWDDETKEVMNLYKEKKNKKDLVEVIYATLDGRIYFLDLSDGSYTRDPINVGMCFKGSGALDPRGYPLLYVGSGDENAQKEHPHMFIISLIDGKILFEYGANDPLSLRKDHHGWSAFDSSPLVDADTDTLIWPGENGLLYTFVLHTDYNAKKGTISVQPDAPVCARYRTDRSGGKKYWYGMECGANIVDHYLYTSENGGMFYCVDLNTMELVWAQDTKDDSNSTPVFEAVSEEEGYIYTAPSLHWTKDASSHGTVSVYKLNALTGEIVWETPYDCYTVEGVSGGVQSSPLLGKPGESIEGLVIYSVSRSPGLENGLLVALDTETGEEVWRLALEYYAWSSPVAVRSADGTVYVVLCDSAGNALLIEGATGKVLDRTSLGGLVEASPVVYGNRLVVGTRDKMIWGMEVK